MRKSLITLVLLVVYGAVTWAQNPSPPPPSAPSEAEDAANKVSAGDKDYSNTEIDRLKESVVDEKVQMRLLRFLTRKEGIGAGATKVIVDFISEMSTRYQIYSLVYKLDGEPVYSFFYGDAVGKTEKDRKPRAFIQSLAPGTHSLEVQVVHTGNDTGVFSYLNDYKILTEKKLSFEVQKEASTKIEVVGYEKGWILTDFKERPDLRIKINGSLIP